MEVIMGKRIFLFLLSNILVITTIGIVLSIIGSLTGVGRISRLTAASILLRFSYLVQLSVCRLLYVALDVKMDGENGDGRSGAES